MLLQTFLDNIKVLVESSVIKYNHLAKASETADSARYADHYMMVYNKRDTFDSYPTFELKAITNAGNDFYYNPYSPSTGTPNREKITAHMMSMDPSYIPADKRAAVLEEQRKLILDGYANHGDRNNYYRKLSGFPELGTPEADLIRLTDEQCERFELDRTVPHYIHKVSDTIIHKLEMSGELQAIQDAHPELEYLHFLGTNRIPVHIARSAKNFELLRLDNSVPDTIYDSFIRIYEQNRSYVSGTLYNLNLANTYDYYDNFMGLLIMVMTIQRMIATSFKKAIQRDLYDWQFIQDLYAAYNIPFIENLPIDVQITIVKNFNLFLRYKGTDKVIFDICSVLGHPDITINQYYFVRRMKRDANNNPIFSDDPNEMYDVEFRVVDMREENVATALQGNLSVMDYDTVTGADPYWYETEELRNEFLKSEFNYMESKYISMNMMYTMTDILFDFTYAFRLIMDKKDVIADNSITIEIPRLSTTKQYSLFDAVVFLIALNCKRYGFEGNIPLTYEEVASLIDTNESTPFHLTSVYGLDFSAPTIITAIRNILSEYGEYLKNPSIDDSEINHTIGTIYDYLSSDLSDKFNVSTADDVNRIYNELYSLRDLLVERMRYTESTDEYYACRQIYETLLVTKYTNDMFDGYKTYDSYIEGLNDAEMLYYLADDSDVTESELNTMIEHVIDRFETILTNADALYYMTIKAGPIYDAIIKLIQFFKSYTVQLQTFNMWYVSSDKYHNMIKTIHTIENIDSEIRPIDSVSVSYHDTSNNSSIFKPRDNVTTTHAVSMAWEDTI